MRSKINLLIAFLLITNLGLAQTDLDDLTFAIRNAGIEVEGFFEEDSLVYQFDPSNLRNSSFKLSIQTSSINTGIGARDKHLRKSKYFDVENYPTLIFSSKQIKKTEAGYTIFGELTMKATTRSIEIPFTIQELDGKQYFIGDVMLDRRDYGVGKNHLILGDEVKINIKTLYQK